MAADFEQVPEDASFPFDDDCWGIVYAFFHPELKEQAGFGLGIGSLFGGLLAENAGIVGSASTGAIAGLPIPPENEPLEEVPATIVFEAYGITRRDQYWRAEIAVSNGLQIGEAVVVSVLNADGEKVQKAILRLLGSDLQVSNGIAAYDLESFQSNLRRTDVALIYPTGVCVEGTLKLGD